MINTSQARHLLFLLLFSCTYSLSDQDYDLQYRYFLSSFPVSTHLGPSQKLISVNVDNKGLVWNEERTKVLAVTWVSEKNYKKFIRNTSFTPDGISIQMWVTLVPEINNFCKQYVALYPDIDKDDLDLRLKQFLGLNPKKAYDLFVEIWVSPDDLYRPCVDPEIHDSICNWNFSNQKPALKNVDNYRELYFQISNTTASAHMPWTGFGYTYDWYMGEMGASEFILVPKAFYEIKEVLTTSAYCDLTNQ